MVSKFSGNRLPYKDSLATTTKMLGIESEDSADPNGSEVKNARREE